MLLDDVVDVLKEREMCGVREALSVYINVQDEALTVTVELTRSAQMNERM